MVFKKDKYHYKRNFQIGLIISLSITILIFSFFPEINFDLNKKTITETKIFSLSDIPQTVQNKNQISSSEMQPPIPLIPFPSEINETEILDNVEVVNNNISDTKNETKTKSENISNSGNLTFAPRQLLEVLPEKSEDDAEGIIKLSLKIGTDGKVNSYKVLSNTTNSSKCLSKVISAAYKSRWEAVKLNGENKEYWIEKSYKFN